MKSIVDYTNKLKDFFASNSALTTQENFLGAKNLIPNNAFSISNNGVDYTVNNDGTVNTLGTSTARSYITLASMIVDRSLIGKNVILSGCPSGGNKTTGYDLCIGFYKNTTWTYYYDTGSGVEFIVPDYDYYTVYIVVEVSGVNMAGKKYYPMLRPVGTDDTYVPYAMTNRELTKSVLNYTFACSAMTGNFVYKIGTDTDSNGKPVSDITPDHVVVECVFDNPAAITSDVTWYTDYEGILINGTCASATSVNVTLVRKGN